MDTNAVLIATIASGMTTFGTLVTIVIVSIVFKGAIKNMLERALRIEAGSSGVKIKLSHSIATAAEDAAQIDNSPPPESENIKPDFKIGIEHRRSSLIAIAAWEEMEQAVKMLARLHFEDYCAAHGTMSGIGRLSMCHQVVEKEYRVVSSSRNTINSISTSNGREVISIDEAKAFALIAKTVTMSLCERIQKFRSTPRGEKRYQEVIEELNPGEPIPDRVIQFPKN